MPLDLNLLSAVIAGAFTVFALIAIPALILPVDLMPRPRARRVRR